MASYLEKRRVRRIVRVSCAGPLGDPLELVVDCRIQIERHQSQAVQFSQFGLSANCPSELSKIWRKAGDSNAYVPRDLA